ncbi:MAG: heme o synthase [Myxococcaceae bacterium]
MAAQPQLLTHPQACPQNRSAGWPAIADFIALTKPRLSALVVLTAVGGAWLAGAPRQPLELLFIGLGIAGIVGAANTFNCYLERDVDAVMRRTQRRPLPSKRMPPGRALAFGVVLAASSTALLAWVSNALTVGLGLLALGLYVGVYTPLKARSAFALWVGAITGALPPLMGWTAVTGGLEAGGLYLFSVLFLWQIPHSLAISLFRKEEYRAAGLKSVPLVYGDTSARWQAALTAGALWGIATASVPDSLAGFGFRATAFVLGGAFFAHAAYGAVRKRDDRWAKALFVHSLAYLPCVFLALALFRVLP